MLFGKANFNIFWKKNFQGMMFLMEPNKVRAEQWEWNNGLSCSASPCCCFFAMPSTLVSFRGLKTPRLPVLQILSCSCLITA